MAEGSKRPLQWVCWACYLHVILAERPSKGMLGVLSTLQEESHNYSWGNWTSDPGFDDSLDKRHEPVTPGDKRKLGVEDVLRSLGVQFEAGGDYCHWPGITCNKKEEVYRVDLHGHREVTGTMVAGAWKKLSALSLVEVDLSNTNVQGNIDAFRFSTKFLRLNLANTNVTGDPAVLKSSSRLRMLNLANTKVRGDIRFLSSMRSLTELQLANTKAHGNIDVLSNSSKLSILNLANTTVRGGGRMFSSLSSLTDLELTNTKVSGDIAALLPNTNLRLVDLARTKVSGDIGLVFALNKLQVVNLANTRVSGDVGAAFLSEKQDSKVNQVTETKLASLTYLNLERTRVSGGIRIFQDAKRLRFLNLKKNKVNGDIEYLRGCPLEHIFLSGTGVGGDIRVVQAFPDLTMFHLDDTTVFGDIKAFESTRKLETLNLYATGVIGDIKAFWRTKQLKWLSLSLTDVSGDIQVFNNSLLLYIVLDATQVEGDIQVFKNMPGVTKLALCSTKVRGDIDAFNSSKDLIDLAISDTEVSGDLKAFSNTTLLSRLRLRKTQVHGSLSALRGLVSLKTLDLSDSQVHGDISVFGNQTNLKVLLLSSTEIKGDVDVFHQSPGLKSMDLSFTKVNGDIRVFRNRRDLGDLRMASTRVWGDLGILVSASFDNRFKVIDLSDTDVEGNIAVLKDALALRELYLRRTQVAGSIDGIIGWKEAAVVDLARTRVTGRLTRHWRGCCKNLRSLKLSGSKSEFLPTGSDLIDLMEIYVNVKRAVLLPGLTTLEVSGCPLNGRIRDLVLPLAFCEHLGSIIAVDCGLHGEFPNLDPLGPTRLDGKLVIGFRSKLASSLEVLEISDNNLTYMESIPSSMRKLVVSSNKSPLRLAKGTLTSALKKGTSINLRGTSLHDDTRAEAQKLLRDDIIQRTPERTFSKEGYTCYDLAPNSTMQVLPSDLLPQKLCVCLPGWHGAGASCHKCPVDTFKPDLGDMECAECPRSTSTNGIVGAQSEDACQCKQTLRDHKGGQEKGNVCNCPNGSAIFDGHCLECFPPLRRCKGGTISAEHCGEGYHGPLCMRCDERYYAVRSSCVKCTGVGWPQWLLMALTFVCIGALLAGGFVAVAYFVYAWSPLSWLDGWIKSAARVIFAPEPLGEWQQQLVKRQAPVLLQTCQLWSVLSSLAARDDKASDMLWELPYVQHVQLAVGNLQEILYLQCFFDGKQVRKMVAFITPAVPLLLLLGCGCLEVWKRGSGVNAALKILTLFFVGGASKCAALITCQRVDAGGWALQSNMTVLRHLPDIDCYQDSMVPPDVAGVFWPCAVGYAILIPSFLFYLYARQHLVLRYTRMPLELASGTTEHLAVSHEDAMLQRRVVAGLVAYVSILQHGSVRVQLRDGKGIAAFLDKPDVTALKLDAEAINAQFNIESEKLRHHSITEMLLERHILGQVGEKDRFLKGAKEMLLKYSTCRDLWMEVMLKLVTVAIVQAIASSTATSDLLMPLGKVLAATLGVAATVWMVRPYAQPQVNDLQVCCFMGLAFAATGFQLHIAWLSRAALLLPLLLAAAQQMQPDSPESLAQRLWEDLVNDDILKKSATTSMLSRQQSQAINFSLEHN
ncbi:unnamed protein product [Durusdinium trenchii]|uniref:Tyrosine-protein kinase ephrin type A/B receptor-like domain-containing protein n=1 Tax=Durusdinium trenchii TaxID=1381693 RepID=A0ABP0NTH6_9DINO